MAATPTTKPQVQAYRFVVRRMEHALIRKDAVMLHDPMRTQSRATAVGVVLGIIGLAGFALFSLFSPADKLGDSPIVSAKDSGAMFVRVEGVLHPVTNLASARLIVGQAASPSAVSGSALTGLPRGALLGIPGGPAMLPDADNRATDVWTVCDTLTPAAKAGAPGQQSSGQQSAAAVASTTVVVGAPAPAVAPLPSAGAMLVQGPPEVGHPDGQNYLIYDGKRAQIDMGDERVTRALGIDGATARPMSAAVLNAIPTVGSVVAPTVPGRGSPPAFSGAGALPTGAAVGSVLRVGGLPDKQFYVVLADGVQSVEPAVARLLEFADAGDPLSVSSSVMGLPPTTKTKLAVQDLPQDQPELSQTADDPVACISWDGTAAPQQSQPNQQATPTLKPTVRAGATLPVPEDAKVVTLAQADASGARLDSAYLPPGKGALVRSVAPGAQAGPLFLVGDTGVRYGVPDIDTAGVLGLSGQPGLVPNQVMALLPMGPELSQSAALRAHDGVASDAQASSVPVPSGP